jgi:hypothetical protein
MSMVIDLFSMGKEVFSMKLKRNRENGLQRGGVRTW